VRLLEGTKETVTTMARKKAMSGPASLFRGKIRGKPLTVLLTPRHWQLLDDAAQRLVLTRSDVIGLLLHRYAASVVLPPKMRTDESGEDE
jgi:hypothetical protein